jgi:CRISPR-associated protein Csx3
MNLLPAVLIGGPPHAGKSVLAYSLSHALRQRGVTHYVLRAYPDGEGNWSNEAEPSLVRTIRVKHWGSPEWIAHIRRDIVRRHVPLIVDPGGKPTDWQAAMFAECTHAILLTRDAASHGEWQRLVQEHGLIILADLHSDLRAHQVIVDDGAVLRGTLAGLERGARASGIVFDALIERVAQLLTYSTMELRVHHFAQAPAELVIELTQLGQTLGALDANQMWQPAALPRVLDYLPAGTAIAIYDAAPNWLYAALALYTAPAEFYQFDARLGWIQPPVLALADECSPAVLRSTMRSHADYTWVEFELADGYIDYTEMANACVPIIPVERGVVLSGKLPLWLWTAIALAYRRASWVAVYQPQFFDQAVVVHSHLDTVQPGQLITLASP